MPTGLEQWSRDMPVVTKYLFASSFGLTLAAHFGLVNPSLLVLHWPSVIQGFEIWRLVTCFVYQGRLGFPFLIHMLFLVRYGQSLEQTVFAGRTADYIFFILFGAVLLLGVTAFMNFPILGMALIMMIIYLWSRKNPNMIMSFMFGIQFQSFYFPWVLVAFDILLGGFPLVEIVGIIVGHVYFFLDEIYPATSGVRLLKTPSFMYSLFPPERAYRDAAPQPQQQRQRNNWGPGQPLGGN